MTAPRPKPPTCEERIAEAEKVDPIPRLDSYYAGVPATEIYAKITPVIYLRAPAANRSKIAAGLFEELAAARNVSKALRNLLKSRRGDRALLREVFLSDGYFFDDRPRVASAAVRILELSDLFDEEVIHLLRGGAPETLRREGPDYVHRDGRRAKLLLNDRVAVDEVALADPYHIDLDAVRALTLAERIRLTRLTSNGAVVRLTYNNGHEAPALVALGDPGPELVCTGGDPARLAAAMDSAKLFWEWVESLNEAAALMVAEKPGFDEPADEPEGDQEDGKLRIAWRKAYHRHQTVFLFREEEYRVFDYRGNPTPPQVCIDFIFDTWERGSGNWFRRRGERPGRSPGFLDFSFIHQIRRHTPSVLEFAAEPGRVLERYDVPSRDRIPFRRGRSFSDALARNADALREGDMVVIHGLREEDMEEHFHTFMVLRTDPLTGVPTVVADNAGRPRIRTVSSAMRSAPRRSIKHRVRVSWDWVSESMTAFLAGRTPPELVDGGMATDMNENLRALHDK